VWRQCRAAPTQEAVQIAGPSKGEGRAFGSVAWGTQDAWALTASPPPQKGKTPLQLALSNGKAEAAKVLRGAGAIE